jgi:hypothetical protein
MSSCKNAPQKREYEDRKGMSTSFCPKRKGKSTGVHRRSGREKLLAFSWFPV